MGLGLRVCARLLRSAPLRPGAEGADPRINSPQVGGSGKARLALPVVTVHQDQAATPYGRSQISGVEFMAIAGEGRRAGREPAALAAINVGWASGERFRIARGRCDVARI